MSPRRRRVKTSENTTPLVAGEPMRIACQPAPMRSCSGGGWEAAMAARARAFIRIAASAAALALLPAGRAAAGPPFQTDDPEPVPYQHFEFYTLSTGTAIRGDTSGVAPA